VIRARTLVISLVMLGTAACEAVTPIGIGVEAPDFSAVDLATGDSVSLHRDYAGQVTLVNIWATWCEPCKEEIPALDSLVRILGPQGLRIAAVSVDVADSSVVSRWIADYDVAFDVLHDRGGAIQRTYLTTGVPESFLIDRDGRIVRIIYSAHPWASPANQRIITELLAAPGPAE
jgi:thiol-disulfide isomerase/thioredoxin